jgi:hypothetical protein
MMMIRSVVVSILPSLAILVSEAHRAVDADGGTIGSPDRTDNAPKAAQGSRCRVNLAGL